jgi:hypothetical protein
MVKESLDEGYCDVTGRTGDLDLIGMCSTSSYIFLPPYNEESTGSMGGIKVFAGPGEILLPDLNPNTLTLIPYCRTSRAPDAHSTQTRCTGPLPSYSQPSCRSLQDSAGLFARLR